MKRSLALLVVILFIPPITAYAASCTTSRHFVVRNTPAEPDPPDLFALPAEQLSIDPPVPATPASTDEVEPEGEDQAIPPESTTPPIFTGEVETPTTPVSTDEVEMLVQGEEQAGEIEQEEQGNEVEQGETSEAEGELVEQAMFFGDDLNAYEVEMGEQSGEIEPEEQNEPEEAEGEIVSES